MTKYKNVVFVKNKIIKSAVLMCRFKKVNIKDPINTEGSKRLYLKLQFLLCFEVLKDVQNKGLKKKKKNF